MNHDDSLSTLLRHHISTLEKQSSEDSSKKANFQSFSLFIGSDWEHGISLGVLANKSIIPYAGRLQHSALVFKSLIQGLTDQITASPLLKQQHALLVKKAQTLPWIVPFKKLTTLIEGQLDSTHPYHHLALFFYTLGYIPLRAKNHKSQKQIQKLGDVWYRPGELSFLQLDHLTLDLATILGTCSWLTPEEAAEKLMASYARTCPLTKMQCVALFQSAQLVEWDQDHTRFRMHSRFITTLPAMAGRVLCDANTPLATDDICQRIESHFKTPVDRRCTVIAMSNSGQIIYSGKPDHWALSSWGKYASLPKTYEGWAIKILADHDSPLRFDQLLSELRRHFPKMSQPTLCQVIFKSHKLITKVNQFISLTEWPHEIATTGSSVSPSPETERRIKAAICSDIKTVNSQATGESFNQSTPQPHHGATDEEKVPSTGPTPEIERTTESHDRSKELPFLLNCMLTALKLQPETEIPLADIIKVGQEANKTGDQEQSSFRYLKLLLTGHPDVLVYHHGSKEVVTYTDPHSANERATLAKFLYNRLKHCGSPWTPISVLWDEYKSHTLMTRTAFYRFVKERPFIHITQRLVGKTAQFRKADNRVI